jgi:ferric-dicitrate binding protein FerR (iron transport regulator)
MISLIDEPKMKTIEKEGTIGTKNTSKSNYKSEWYKNMTLEQKEARRECQRLYNSEPKHKEALKLSKKKIQRVAEAHPAPRVYCHGEPVI